MARFRGDGGESLSASDSSVSVSEVLDLRQLPFISNAGEDSTDDFGSSLSNRSVERYQRRGIQRRPLKSMTRDVRDKISIR